MPKFINFKGAHSVDYRHRKTPIRVREKYIRSVHWWGFNDEHPKSPDFLIVAIKTTLCFVAEEEAGELIEAGWVPPKPNYEKHRTPKDN